MGSKILSYSIAIIITVLSSTILVGCGKKDSNKGMVLLQESRSVGGEEKLNMLKQAYNFDNSNNEIVIALAEEALKQGQYELANKAFKQLESIEGFIEVGKLGRVRVALTQGDEQLAGDIINEFPESVLTADRMVAIGSTFYEFNYLLLASQRYEQAITIDRKHIKAWTNIGVVQADLGELEVAAEFMQEALKLSPNNQVIQLNLATLFGDLAFQAREDGLEATVYVSQALELINAILEMDPQNSNVLTYKGVLFYENGNYNQAQRIFESLIQENPKHEDAYYYLGKTLVELGSDDEAVEVFIQLLEINPDHPRAPQELIDLTAHHNLLLSQSNSTVHT